MQAKHKSIIDVKISVKSQFLDSPQFILKSIYKTKLIFLKNLIVGPTLNLSKNRICPLPPYWRSISNLKIEGQGANMC